MIYVLASTLTGGCWVFYSEKVQNSPLVSTKKRSVLYCLPILILLLIIMSTPWTKLYFFFEDGHYQRGSIFLPLSSLTLIYVVETGLVALIKSFKKASYVNRREYRRLFIFAVVYTSIQYIQLFLPDIFPYRSVGIMLMFGYFLLQSLKETVSQDHLTHINNRFAAERMLGALIDSKEQFEIAIIDVDKFKKINDKYGHLEGDKALRYLSSSILAAVDRSCFVARMGGDEFIIINSNPSNSIINVEEEINKQLRVILERYDSAYSFTASVGYAIKDETIKSIPDLIALADSRMYERKKQK